MAAQVEIPVFLGASTRLQVVRKKPLFSNFLAFFAAAPRPSNLSRPLVMEKQEPTEWCWAAVASAVKHYLDREYLGQRQVADRFLPGLGCSTNPWSSQCNAPASLAAVLRMLGNLEEFVPQSLDLGPLTQQMRADRPVCCALSAGNQSHLVVVTATFLAQGVPFVTLKDPAYGDSEKTVRFADLRRGYIPATWDRTYFTRPQAA